MKRTHKAKGVAGLGILSMLMGALMVFAPPASSVTNPSVGTYEGNKKCTDYGYTHELKDEPVDTSGDPKTIDDGILEVTYTAYVDDRGTDDTSDDRLTIDWTSAPADSQYDGLVRAVLLKQGNGGAVFTYNAPGSNSGTVYVIPEGSSSALGISHLSFCHKAAKTTTTVSEATTSTSEGTTTTTEGTTTTTEATTTTTEATTTTTEATTTTTEATTTTTEDTTTTTEGDVLSTTTVVDDTTTTEGPAVQGDSVTTAPEVLDNSVAAGSLPNTGSATDRLAPVGAALMILGAILVGGSRRSLIARD